MKKWFLSTELIGLDGMPNKVGSISVRANRENWKSRKAKTGGRSMEYHISNFDEHIIEQLKNAADFEKSLIPNDYLGLTKEEISDFFQNDDTKEKISELFKKNTFTTPPSLNKQVDSEIDHQAKTIELDFYDVDANAGPGVLALQEKKSDSIIFNKDFLINSLEVLPENVFLMPVRGDSMHPTLKNKAIVMVNKITEFSGDGVYVFRFDGQLMVKRLQFSKTGLTVVSDNASYKEWELTRDELANEDFEIIGEVVWSGQRM